MALFDLQREGEYQRNFICRMDGCNEEIQLGTVGVCKKCKEKKHQDCKINGVRFSFCARYKKYKPLVLKMPRNKNGGVEPSCNYCRNQSILVPSVKVLSEENLLPCPTPDVLARYAPRAKIRMLQPHCAAVWQCKRGTGLPTHFAPPPIQPMIISNWGSRRRRSIPAVNLMVQAPPPAEQPGVPGGAEQPGVPEGAEQPGVAEGPAAAQAPNQVVPPPPRKRYRM